MPKISIIIPIYNAENYLERCLLSALNQNLHDIEIICVDDCSTDASKEILKNFSSEYSRVKIISHAYNKGEGSARNSGYDNASGDFIFNLDADDTIPDDALTRLYHIALEHSSELVKGRFKIIGANGDATQLRWSAPSEVTINTNIKESEFLQRIPGHHCSYLFNRRFIQSNNLRYPDELVCGLDIVFLAKVLNKANKVTTIPNVVYHYHETPNSIIRGNVSLEIALDTIRTKEIVSDLLTNNLLTHAAQKVLQTWSYMIDTLWIRMHEDLSVADILKVFELFRSVILQHQIIPWDNKTPTHFRYILSLVIAGQDKLAIELLQTNEARSDLSDSESLIKMIQFILSTFPNDKTTINDLLDLISSSRTDNEIRFILSRFIQSESNLSTLLNILEELIEQEEYRSARKVLDALYLNQTSKVFAVYNAHKLSHLESMLDKA